MNWLARRTSDGPAEHPYWLNDQSASGQVLALANDCFGEVNLSRVGGRDANGAEC